MGPDNLVTRFARNNDSSNPYLLLSKKKTDTHADVCFLFGRGIRIRTLNDGVRVRSVTVTLYLYIIKFTQNARQYTHNIAFAMLL